MACCSRWRLGTDAPSSRSGTSPSPNFSSATTASQSGNGTPAASRGSPTATMRPTATFSSPMRSQGPEPPGRKPATPTRRRSSPRPSAKAPSSRTGGSLVLLPGAQGFGAGDRPDGPVINLSYWIFEAFPVMAALAPEYEWTRVWRDGVLLLQQATSGRVRLPADWISLQNGLQPKPADGFPPEFGYNSLRIPLYLLRAGMTEMEWLRALKQRWSAENEGVAVVNVVTGQVRERLTDQGYAMLPAAARLRARRDADSGAAEDLRAEPLLPVDPVSLGKIPAR